MSEKPIRLRDEPSPRLDEHNPEVALEILRAVQEIQYGSVEVIVHDSRVVQIERKEKIRIGGETHAKRR